MSSGAERRKEWAAAFHRGLRRLTEDGEDFDLAVSSRLKLHVTDFRCLSLLVLAGPMTAGQLADQTGLTPGAVTGVLDRLEKAGFASRTRDPNDRRLVFIQANTEREPELVELIGGFTTDLEEAIRDFDEPQLQVIQSFIAKTGGLFRDHAERLRDLTAAFPKEGKEAYDRGSRTEARLRFSQGASRIELRADGRLQELYKAEFTGRKPSVKVEGDTVQVQYSFFSPFDWGRSSAVVSLHANVRWALEFKGGVSKLNADLKELHLGSIELTGGASHVTVMLPPPAGKVLVRIKGGASHVTLLRPKAHVARLELRGGASKLKVDGQQFGSVGGRTVSATEGYEGAHDAYDFEVSGGASDLTIGTY